MIPLIRPDLRFEEVAADIERIIDSGILTNGKYVEELELAVAERVGAEHAVATTSATTAMHLGLACHEIGAGDEVLISDFTFPATGNVVASLGATPVLVDSRSDTFCLDVERALDLVTPRTRAIIAVHPFGQPVGLDELALFVDKAGIVCIEDAACALGSYDQGRHCGSLFTGCFSFHPRKVVTTGEGGMLTTNDDVLADRARRLRNHGGIPSRPAMEFVDRGFNYRMAEVPAAMGLAQLRRLDAILEHRRSVAAAYQRDLERVEGIDLRLELPGQTWSFQSFVVMVADNIDRDSIITAMRARGVETTIGTYALHSQPAYAGYGYAPGDLPNSFAAQGNSLTLPLPPDLSDSGVDRVVQALKESINESFR